VARIARTRLHGLILAVSVLRVLVSAASAQTDVAPDLKFRSDVTEVRLTFSTTDIHNHVLATVQPADFAVVDQDRVIHNFKNFSRTEYTRLDIAILIDASNSLTPQFRQEMAQVVELLAQTRGVPDDSVSVVSFQDLKPAVVCEGNCRTLAESQFPVVRSGGLTPLYDSIVFTSRILAGHTDLHARKVLILFSDGMDTIIQKSFTDALDSAVDHDIAVYSIDTSKKPHTSQGTSILRSLCVNTGGRYFSMEMGTEQVVDAVLKDFHATYTVAYKLPTQAMGFHQVQIFPTHDLSLQFHCRRGYYYPANPEN